ncbi:MAG: sulfurtransferase [SAR202 cluster bacterium]|nr:sulfurtransferase [Chloroflexota bacterium]MQG16938.1 sulfurtransferase [SAR202 cluster bacterium]MQG36326.1 sulfurtransferase [SAR202 cluster bacterium]MQG87129.1 sulfurtransferase [SAR202 cluster bacterium]|tara:strand:- start:5154 stop:6122 length:969 start_codon:yes stop_codon:yes gene_type:complete
METNSHERSEINKGITNTMKFLNLPILLILLAVCIGCTTSNAVDNSFESRGYANTDKLVSAEWLNKNLGQVKIIDVRKEEDFIAGHIPGAVRITPNEVFQWEDTNGVKGMLPSADHIATALSAVGIDNDDTVIFYDGKSNLWASRGLWALEVYGHEDARLLDGSWVYWSENGYPTSVEINSITETNYEFSGTPDNDLVASWDEILESVDDPSKIVCDTRSPDEYVGKDVRADRGGHIPGSENVNWVNAVDDSGQFLSAEKLTSIYESKGIRTDKAVYTLCQTAVRATHTWFVLQELLGYDNVQVYDGSWIEWGNSDLPIETN